MGLITFQVRATREWKALVKSHIAAQDTPIADWMKAAVEEKLRAEGVHLPQQMAVEKKVRRAKRS